MNLLDLFTTPRAATGDSTPSWWPEAVMRGTSSGVAVTPDIALTYSVVWACTRVLTGTGAMLPLNLMRREGKRTEVADDHPVQRVLHDEPNSEMTSMGFRLMMLQNQINAGNAYAEIVRVGGRLNSLWPISPSRVRYVRDRSGQPFYNITNDDGSTTEIEPENMLHVPALITADGRCGKGVVTLARESIGMGLATEQQGAAYFGNGARPAVVIVGGKFKDAAAREDYRRQWVEHHGGPRNNARPALLPEGADLKNLSFTPEDSQFLQTRQHNVEEVCRWYGVPPHMVGHLLRSTFNNIEAQSREFVIYGVLQWLVLHEQEYRRKLLTPVERRTMFVRHSIEGLLRGDSTARANFYSQMLNTGVYSVNEVRELEDMNPLPEDVRLFPLNMTTDPGAEQQAATATAATMPDDDDMMDDDNAAARTVLRDTVARMLDNEVKACSTAARKAAKPKDFFAWLDDFYAKQASKLLTALDQPWQAAGRLGCQLLAYVNRHCAESLEAILQMTEVPAAEWPIVGDRIAALAETWKATRLQEFDR